MTNNKLSKEQVVVIYVFLGLLVFVFCVQYNIICKYNSQNEGNHEISIHIHTPPNIETISISNLTCASILDSNNSNLLQNIRGSTEIHAIQVNLEDIPVAEYYIN